MSRKHQNDPGGEVNRDDGQVVSPTLGWPANEGATDDAPGEKSTAEGNTDGNILVV